MFYIYGFVESEDKTSERRDFVMLKADGTLGGFDDKPVLVVKTIDGACKLKYALFGDMAPYFNLDDLENLESKKIATKMAKHW